MRRARSSRSKAGIRSGSDEIPGRAKREPGTQKHAMSKLYGVYLMASKRNGALYVGVTSDLPKRVFRHKN